MGHLDHIQLIIHSFSFFFSTGSLHSICECVHVCMSVYVCICEGMCVCTCMCACIMHLYEYMHMYTMCACVYVCKFAGMQLNVANMRKVKGYLQGRHLTTAWLQHLRKCLLQ